MDLTYRELTIKSPSEHCRLYNARTVPEDLSLDSEAQKLMVDFSKVPPTTATMSLSVAAALDLMKANRIRALMIVDDDGEFAGVITAMDLMGRKPLLYASEARIPRDEVLVKNIMLPKNSLKAVTLQEVLKSSVGDVMHTLRKFSEQHILVVDGEGNDMQVCGLFSSADFRRALDVDFETPTTAHTFADLERVIHEQKDVI